MAADKNMRKYHEAFKIAVAITAGTFIYQFFQLPYGHWLPLAIAFIYVGGKTQGLVMKRANDRFLGNLFGLLFAGLFASLLMSWDYRWGYILPAIWFGAFYFYFLMDYWYFIRQVFLSAFAVLLVAIMNPAHENLNLWETMFDRMICVVFGGIVLLICEFTIFREATSVKSDIIEMAGKFFCDCSEYIISVSERYLKKENVRYEFWPELASVSEKYSVGKKLYSSLENELGHDITQNVHYEKFYDQLRKICGLLRSMKCIVNHPGEYNMTESDSMKIREASDVLSKSFKALLEQKAQWVSVREKLLEIFKGASSRESASFPERLFTEKMMETADCADKLHEILCSLPHA
ncbi:MAG: FUSC family protein, partial [Bacteroidia bacterium]|nr:FUSC family protein [Bacteroidia bacterium]